MDAPYHSHGPASSTGAGDHAVIVAKGSDPGARPSGFEFQCRH